jgi:hypothetical protein
MKAQIYVNRHVMAANKKATKETGEIVDNEAIAVNTYLGSIYCKKVEFTQGCKLIQDAKNALCSGAGIWIEIDDFETLIIDDVEARRSMFKKRKVLDLEEYFWQFVEEAGWNNNKDYQAIAKRLSPKYGADREALQVMFRELKRNLSKNLDDYFDPEELEVSDDGFDDLVSHIIGMGKEEYYRVLNKPDKAIAYRNSCVESFAYVLLELRA